MGNADGERRWGKGATQEDVLNHWSKIYHELLRQWPTLPFLRGFPPTHKGKPVLDITWKEVVPPGTHGSSAGPDEALAGDEAGLHRD